MAYNNLRVGRFSQVGMAYHITTVTKNRTPYFDSFELGRLVVRELMRLQAENHAQTL